MPAHNTLHNSIRNVMVHIFFQPARASRRLFAMATALGVALVVGGCASVPPPDNAMNLAQNQLQAARDADAADYAPVDLGFAQDKFQQAQTAMAQRKYADAANLAEESRADAELARAKARLGAARAQIQAKVQQNARLRQQGEQDTSSPATAAGDYAPADDSAPPLDDMPAPPTSALTEPPSGEGFQTVPSTPAQPGQNPIPSDQGSQP
jgi:hypothetical protein